MDAKRVSFNDYWRLVSTNRNFRLLWFAQIVSELGDWLYCVAVYCLIYELTGSAKAIALVIVLQVLPQVLASPAAGVLNDRISRKRLMIFADWMRAAIVLGMLLVRSRELIPLLYVLLFLETLMWGLFEPGRSAVIPNITKGAETLAANALSSTTWALNFTMGFAAGGLLAAAVGRDAVFVINSLSFVLSAFLLQRMRFFEPHVVESGRRQDRLPHLMRYLWQDRRLAALLFVKGGLGLMGANWVLLPIMGERVFHIEVKALDPRNACALGMSVLLSSRGLGALLGTFGSGWWAGFSETRLRIGILYGFLAAAAGYLALAVAPSLPWACAALVLAHGGGSTVWVFSTTLLQLQSDDKFRGRVFSAEFAFMTFTIALTGYAAGVLLDFGISIRTLVCATGLLLLLPAIAWTFALRFWPKPQSQ